MIKFLILITMIAYALSNEIQNNGRCQLENNSLLCKNLNGTNWYFRRIKKKVYCLKCDNQFNELSGKRLQCDNDIYTHKYIIEDTKNICEFTETKKPTASPVVGPPTTPAPTTPTYFRMFKEACITAGKECNKVRWHPKLKEINTRGTPICERKKGRCRFSNKGKKIAKKLDKKLD